MARDPYDEEPMDEEEIIRNRLIAIKMAREAASHGDPLAGMLSELERASQPFFLGLDYDTDDDSDMDVWP